MTMESTTYASCSSPASGLAVDTEEGKHLGENEHPPFLSETERGKQSLTPQLISPNFQKALSDSDAFKRLWDAL